VASDVRLIHDPIETPAVRDAFELTHPITATIYDGNGVQLAQVTQPQTIPFRPTADPSCPANSGPAPAGAAWFNPLAPGGGACQNSIGKVLTFNFPAGTPLPNTVIWTVAFNTSTAGYSPIGSATCQSDPGGCPYDSLNVGAKTYAGAPYAGTDIQEDEAFRSSGGPGAPLLAETGWSANRPLGEIITG
jgi:hypothetical protein